MDYNINVNTVLKLQAVDYKIKTQRTNLPAVKEKEWRLNNKDKEAKSAKLYRRVNPEKCLYSRTKAQAKVGNMHRFDLTIRRNIIVYLNYARF